MNNTWFFGSSSEMMWLSGLACLLLAGLLTWLELQKKTANAALRIVLSWLAIGALLLAAWQPAFRQSLPVGQAVLLTENIPQQQLDSLKQRYPGLQLYSLEKRGEGKYLPHPGHLQKELAAGSKLYILGSGLPATSLTYLQEYQLHHLPGPPVQGLEALSFPHQLSLGERFSLRGRWEQPAYSVLLKLSLAGKLVDSVFIYPEGKDFALQHTPRLPGRLQYRLWAENQQQDTLENIPLQVAVKENEQLQLALFTAYPTFESKYLKNWLTRQGHSLFYQAEMAPQRYTREWINLPDKTWSGLNKKLLREVDLLVLDQAYFSGLSAANHQLIESAVEEGLGVLLLASGASLSSYGNSWANLPPLRLSGRVAAGSLPVGGQGEGAAGLDLYEADSPGWYSNEESPGLRYVPYGLGRVGVNLAVETFPLVLKDREEAYARQWTNMLNELAPVRGKNTLLEADFPAIAGERQRLTVWQTGKETPELVLAEPNGRKQVLPLIQDSRLPERWFAYYWPGKSGKYALTWPGYDSLLFQVLASGSLPALKAHKKAVHLQGFSKSLEEGERTGEETSLYYSQTQEVPLYWLYLLFLLCLSGLWVERKLNTP